jgi:hypothetical protein
LLLALLTVLVSGVLAGPAQAADGFRYWNYFHLQDGSWAFSQVGPGDYQPEDGAVEGYRYGTSTTAEGIAPRADLAALTFERVCAHAQADSDQKRVAVLIDYGTAADAEGADVPDPRAACAVVPDNASGRQVLASVADLRAEKGLTCAVDGYPATGCGEPVADVPAQQKEEPVAFTLPADSTGADGSGSATSSADSASDEGAPWSLLALGGVVVVVAAGGVLLARRNKAA